MTNTNNNIEDTTLHEDFQKVLQDLSIYAACQSDSGEKRIWELIAIYLQDQMASLSVEDAAQTELLDKFIIMERKKDALRK